VTLAQIVSDPKTRLEVDQETYRRLRDGKDALGMPASSDGLGFLELRARASVLSDGIAALQSLGDLGKPSWNRAKREAILVLEDRLRRTNKRAWAEKERLEKAKTSIFVKTSVRRCLDCGKVIEHYVDGCPDCGTDNTDPVEG
jgi:hypothetical protein